MDVSDDQDENEDDEDDDNYDDDDDEEDDWNRNEDKPAAPILKFGPLTKKNPQRHLPACQQVLLNHVLEGVGKRKPRKMKI